ncbi:PIN domain-containing protein [Halococcus hamelinensis]|uniref:PIN domain-containing protein n=1 Tax=Halococcus hamelinensis TaxID=332168 RepID=UPI00029B1629|nr:PIN domain-containing protein [Halococcus hamelinensis]
MHSNAETNISKARQELAWGEIVEVSQRTAVIAAEVADEIGPLGPNLTAVDALVAAVGRELSASVVSGDGDLTHKETKEIIEVDDY